MLLAETVSSGLTPEGWAIIIAAFGASILIPLVKIVIDEIRIRRLDRERLADKIEEKNRAKQIELDLKASTEDTKQILLAQDEKQAELAAVVEKVQVHTNQLSQQAIASAAEAGRAQGALGVLERIAEDEGMIAKGIVEGLALANAEKASDSARGELVKNGPKEPVPVVVENEDRIKVDTKSPK